MTTRRLLSLACLALVCAGWAQAQDVCASWGWEQSLASARLFSPFFAPAETVSLTVPEGITLQVALDAELKVKKVGQPVQGRLVEAVYAFDQEVVPVGSEVWGRISKIEGVSAGRRFLAALNANFTPARKVEMEFDQLVLPDGERIPIDTVVTPGSGQPIQLVTTADNDKKKTTEETARDKMKQALAEAKQKWREAMQQVKEPGKMHRLKRYAAAQLPVHPQYVDAGTVYFAELKQPLDFGSRPRKSRPLNAPGSEPPPCNLLAHAQLVTPLSSATTPKDASVEAVLTQPLLAGDRLVFPQGTLLKGSVVQVESARRLKRHGKLRILFNEVVPPGGIEQEVDANLEGIQAGGAQRVRLGPEGGTRATSSRKRYVAPGITAALAAASYQDSDVEDGVASAGGGASQGAYGGAAAFRLVGGLVGAFVRSQPLSLGMGIFGAARSGYSSFLGRGQDVVFPKGTAMEIGLWLSRNCNDSPRPERRAEVTGSHFFLFFSADHNSESTLNGSAVDDYLWFGLGTTRNYEPGEAQEASTEPGVTPRAHQPESATEPLGPGA